MFHLRDGKVVEFWDASTDQYGYDELLGCFADVRQPVPGTAGVPM